MGYLKWGLAGGFWILVFCFLHYTLPQHDIVRVTDTYSRITPIKYPIFWSGSATPNDLEVGRDTYMIETRKPDGAPMIYRNEDTDWGWPPYFKFDTANLKADASNFVSTADNPKWVVITHYGWRNEFLTIFPNAIDVRPVEGPDVRIIPWFNIGFLTVLAAIYWAIRVRWKRFRKNRVEPVVDEWTDGWG